MGFLAMASPIGKFLNEKLGLGAKHALYREDGRWYQNLERFPGVFFDRKGYLLFETVEEYERCAQLRRGTKLNVTGGISNIIGYLPDGRIESFLTSL